MKIMDIRILINPLSEENKKQLLKYVELLKTDNEVEEKT